jgi:hypothetical protein
MPCVMTGVTYQWRHVPVARQWAHDPKLSFDWFISRLVPIIIGDEILDLCVLGRDKYP